jgi:ribulose-phosphate 3-epimerase
MIIAPSILSANFWHLGQDIERLQPECLHVDVMDGHFVPNLTMGPMIVSHIREQYDGILDVHLMVDRPQEWLEPFAKAGANWISFHLEATPHPHRLLQQIKSLGCKAGLVLNPGTPPLLSDACFALLDHLLIMSVNPGFGGQRFIGESLESVRHVVGERQRRGASFLIEMDGGINEETIGQVRDAGVDVAVAGSSVFAQNDPKSAYNRLCQLAKGS